MTPLTWGGWPVRNDAREGEHMAEEM